MLNTQTGLGLTDMPSTPPSPPPPPPIKNNNNNNNDDDDIIQQEFERFLLSEQAWEDDTELRDVYLRNFNLIRDSDQVHRRTRTYN